MAYGRITQKQSEILEYIKSQILNKGYPPSVRDICQAVNLKSTSSVHAHLESLEKNGYIRRDPTKSRTIEIIDDNFNLSRREVVNIPLLGQVAAGQPLLAVENITEYFPIPSEYMPGGEVFMLKVIIDALQDKKAEDIRVIDISNVSVIADYFVIASGSNTNQIQAMVDNVEEEMFKAGYDDPKVEGYNTASWILLDYKDVIVHVFSEDDRAFYNIERIWRDGKEVDINSL